MARIDSRIETGRRLCHQSQRSNREQHRGGHQPEEGAHDDLAMRTIRRTPDPQTVLVVVKVKAQRKYTYLILRLHAER